VAECECLSECLFFNDKMEDMSMSSLASVYKKTYCFGDNSTCARHVVLVALGRERVPADMFPNEHDRAEAILSGR
jgi:hypothetical protein